MEIRPLDPSLHRQNFDYGTIEAAKGCGRVSVLLFTLTYTYVNLLKNMTPEEAAEFQKRLACCGIAGHTPSGIKGSPLTVGEVPNLKGDTGGASVAFPMKLLSSIFPINMKRLKTLKLMAFKAHQGPYRMINAKMRKVTLAAPASPLSSEHVGNTKGDAFIIETFSVAFDYSEVAGVMRFHQRGVH